MRLTFRALLASITNSHSYCSSARCSRSKCSKKGSVASYPGRAIGICDYDRFARWRTRRWPYRWGCLNNHLMGPVSVNLFHGGAELVFFNDDLLTLFDYLLFSNSYFTLIYLDELFESFALTVSCCCRTTSRPQIDSCQT
jgi:hypothetical protein